MATSAAALADTEDTDRWKQLAACRGCDVNRFHTESKLDHVWAKSICAKCPVVRDCLEYALPYDKANSWSMGLGIYGGLTAEERRLFWDRLRRAKWPSKGGLGNG